jgi:hypothetical protein
LSCARAHFACSLLFGILCFCPGQPQTNILLLLPPRVVGIIGVCLHAQPPELLF